MKKQYLFGLALTLASMSLTSFASSCYQDRTEMLDQIRQYDSITSVDGYRFHDVTSPTTSVGKFCTANGYAFNRYFCKLKWEAGNWGDTLHCS